VTGNLLPILATLLREGNMVEEALLRIKRIRGRRASSLLIALHATVYAYVFFLPTFYCTLLS
jgi:hypothetical protein